MPRKQILEAIDCYSEDELICLLSRCKSISFNGLNMFVNKLYDRFGINSFKFLQYLNIDKIGYEKVLIILDRYKSIPIIRELMNNSIDGCFDIDYKYYLKEAKDEIQSLKMKIESLKNKLQMVGFFSPKESDLNKEFLDRYFEPKDQESWKEKLLYGCNENDPMINVCLQRSILNDNPSDVSLFMNCASIHSIKSIFGSVCCIEKWNILKLFMKFFPGIVSVSSHAELHQYPINILKNKNLNNINCNDLFEALEKNGCYVNSLTLREAVINNRTLDANYLILRNQFGKKMLKRLTALTSNNEMLDILRRHIF